MGDQIDYLAIERHDQPEGSYNWILKNLVVGIRYIRERIPATEVKQNMPPLRELENKLQTLDISFGNTKREYIQEIMEVLDNEPEPDETTSFSVFELTIKENSEALFYSTGRSFSQEIIAEEWVRESGEPAVKYVVLKVIERL